MEPAPRWPKQLAWVCVQAAILFAVFLAIYVRIGTAFPERALLIQDLMFDADYARVVGDMTGGPTANYERTNVHPLFLVLFNPIAYLFMRAGTSRLNAVIYVDAFLGGLALVLSLMFFTATLKGRWFPFLFSCLLGFSLSHLFWCSVPGNYVAGVCSIIFCYLLLALAVNNGTWRGRLAWIVAGILTLGTTVTNFMHAIIAHLFSTKGRVTTRSIGTAKIMLAAFLFVALGNLVQQAIYPESSLFFTPSNVYRETEFVFPDLVTMPKFRLRTLLEGFFVFNIVAPPPYFFYPTENTSDPPGPPTVVQSTGEAPDKPAETASSPPAENPADPPFPVLYYIYISIFDFKGPGLVAAVAWLLLLGCGLLFCFQDRRNPLILALSTGVAFQVALHSIYGYEPFLYSPHVTFQVLSLVALGIGRKYDALWIAFVACVLVLVAVNNLDVIATIVQAYQNVPGAY